MARFRPKTALGATSGPCARDVYPPGMRRSWTWVLAAALTLAGCLAAPDPASRPPSRPAASPESGTLRVVSYNIRHGRGMDGRVNLERTAGVLRALEPDLVGLQEVDERVGRSGGVDQAAELGGRLGLEHAFGAFMAFDGGRYGMALLSRHPITRAWEIPLPAGNEPRVALAAEIAHPAGPFVAVNVHFDWVGDDGFRFAQASTLARALDELARPYVLLGDFNDEPGSRTLELFHARADEAEKPAAERATFPSPAPTKEIDFVFAAPHGAWQVGPTRVVDEREASDHRPVLANLRRP